MKIFVSIPFFSLLVSYDMGIWNKKTTLIKINNNEKGFIKVKETIQASHQQWNIKKITIFFRSGKSWFGLVNHLGSPDRMSYNFFLQFRIHWDTTARTARFSKKSLGSDVGEIKKMSEKFKKKLVFTPRNVRENSNTVIYYKMPTKHRHWRIDAAK